MGLYNIAAHQKPKSYPRCLAAPKRWNRFSKADSSARSRPSAAAALRLLLLCMWLREQLLLGHVEDSHPEGRPPHRRPEGANLECRAYLLAPIGLPTWPC
jgi:hypothetical protein